MSPSMEPTLGVGEIALMAKVRGTPEVGDIVQVPVPREVQRDKGYPSAVVHRIIEIKDGRVITQGDNRSEEHTSEPQSLMRNSYDVLCLKKKKKQDKS